MFEEGQGFGPSAVERVVLRKQQPRLGNEPDRKIVINVSGMRYETFESTLARFPETVLGSEERRKAFYDPVDREYFFDRNRICFESILAYYQTGGIIIRPPSIPRNVFISDVRFFELGDDALEQAGDDLDKSQEEERPMPGNKLMRIIWNLFEYPDTSTYARCVAIISVGIIVLSIFLFCLETLPEYQSVPVKVNNSTETIMRESAAKHDFFIAEAFCITWFTLEYVMRLGSSPNKWKFLVSVLNIIDLIAILPFFITLLLTEPGSLSSLAVLRCVRLVRVFRIFKLSRYSRGLQILGHTLKASLRELGLLFFFLVVGVILFSSAVYYAEFGYEGENLFESIPHSFWWAIITMTTVGYGDMAPKTLAGKLVGMLCAITGVLAIALPVPVIVSNFAYYYSREQARQANSAVESDDENENENNNHWNLRQQMCARLICKSPPAKKKKKKKKGKNGKQYTEVQVKMDRNGEVVKSLESSDATANTPSTSKDGKEELEAIETLV